MRVAISLFKECVTPRLDISDSILIYHIGGGAVAQVERYQQVLEQPGQLIAFLKEKQVDKVIVGGCPGFFLRMLLIYEFDVFVGLTGSPGDAIQLMLDGKLVAESLPAGRKCCRRERLRKGRNEKE
ncbi:MAG: hypothetical protein GY765_31140 [bacterium]|nr:hypothetical protein [bacterium]